MIATTLRVLVEAEPALRRLAALPMPIKAAYRTAKLARLIREDTRLFYEQRNAVVRSLGVEGPPGQFTVPAEQLGAFQAQLTDLLAVDVTVPCDPLDLASLGPVAMTAEDLIALGPLVTGEPA